MKIENIFNVAIKNILKSRMRSLLTTLGIIIGVGSVVIMVAIGQGAQQNIQNQIGSLGSNLIIIYPGSSRMGGINRGAGSINRFTLDDVEKIEDRATLIKGVSPMVQAMAQVIYGSNNWSTSIYGVSTEYLDIRSWKLSSGDFFTERDVKTRAKVAVLGQDVVDNLFPDGDAIGKQIRIRNVPFKVIGVLEEKGQSAMGASNDDLILAPSTTVLSRLAGGQYINFIYASAISTETINEAQEEIRSIMRDAHKLNASEEDDFTISNQVEIIDTISESAETMTMFLASVAGVSLLVGGIGIMNIMLVSVTERTREIGIRLSVGARERDILVQFLTEAMVLSLFGGIIGIIISAAAVYLINNYTSQAAMLNTTIIFIAFLFSGAVGIFFGYYPAKKAAAMNPIEALRYE